MRRLIALLALTLSTAALHAQGTAADSAHWRDTKVDLDSIARDKTAPLYSKRAQARIRVRDSLRTVGPVTPPPQPVPVPTTSTLSAPVTTLLQGRSTQVNVVVTDQNGAVMAGVPLTWKSGDTTILDVSATGIATGRKAGQGVVWATPTTALGAAGSLTITVQDTALTPADTTTKPDTTTPSGASIAAQPKNVATRQYPACTTTVRLLAGGDLQAALNSAQAGTCILLAPGGSFIRNHSLPDRASAGYVTVTTDGYVSTPGTRMTPSKAVASNLAKILSPSYTEAIGTAPGAHGFIFRGVEIATTPAVQQTSMNMLVRLTDPTVAARPPSDIQFQEVYVHGTPTLDMRRSFRADGPRMVLVDSYVDDIHSNNSDSQAWLGLNCAAYQLIENNTLRAGHEIVMFGGGDPSSQACIPHDIVLRRNHIMHPLTWYKVWQVKNCIETKNVISYLIEGNVIENCWPDAQAGFAFVMKSENQDCGPIGQYSTTSDVTIRYNIVEGAGNGFNLSGKGSNSCPNITSARYDIHDNVFKDFARSQATEVQLLTMVTDVQLQRNTFLGVNAGGSAFSMDAGPTTASAVRLVVKGTALHVNAYGVKAGGMSSGTPSLSGSAPGYVWTDNFLAGTTSCTNYPATTTCAATFPSLPSAKFGADTSIVNRLTAGVVVTDPLVAARARTAINPRALKYPWKESPKACQTVGHALPMSCETTVLP